MDGNDIYFHLLTLFSLLTFLMTPVVTERPGAEGEGGDIFWKVMPISFLGSKFTQIYGNGRFKRTLFGNTEGNKFFNLSWSEKTKISYVKYQ